MKGIPRSVSFGLTSLALLGLVAVQIAGAPTQAQQPAAETVLFKANLAGPLAPGFVIPLDAPVVSDDQSTTGQATELGEVTYVEHSIAHLGVDGRAVFVSDGVGVLTGANGDAVFISFGGLVRPAGAEFGYTITGGRGRFKGATGHGVIACVRDRVKNQQTRTFEGVISRPNQ
jgi:hypothetical protein